MFRFNFYILTIISLFSNCLATDPYALKSTEFVIISNDHSELKWANYLYSHLHKRSKNGPSIHREQSVNGLSKKAISLSIRVDTKLTSSYEIERLDQHLSLIAQSDDIALWLIYELMAKIGEENTGINIADLPPSTLQFATGRKNFDFAYREPFLSPNTHLDYARILGNHSIDADWGIWGHQLDKIVDWTDQRIWAQVNGKPSNKQLCFSSETLFEQINHYIIDQYGHQPRVNFMLAPNDNDLVCECHQCQAVKNTTNNASPAVLNLNNQLAKKYPTAQFFMLAYRTTKQATAQALEPNVGVFLSTIDLPKGQRIPENEPHFQTFKRQLDQWKKQTKTIYLWDYAANFDDYLTPIPILYGFQEQAKQFKRLGIKGFFINASGYDYAPFDDVKTYILSALMRDSTVDIDQLAKRYFQRYYPQSHQLLYTYYKDLENEFRQKDIPYGLYEGFSGIENSYLNIEKFHVFYSSLGKQLANTKDDERLALEKLYTTLSFTQLQIAYSKGFSEKGAFKEINQMLTVTENAKQPLTHLQKATSTYAIKNYSERNQLQSYVKQWEKWLNHPLASNQLSPTDILTPSLNIEGLTDKKLGFPFDFLMGWTIVNTDLHLTINQLNPGVNQIQIRFLNDPDHNIFPPSKVYIQLPNGSSVQAEKRIIDDQITVYQFDANKIPSSKGFQLHIINTEKTKSQWASDEIQFLNI